MNWEPESLRKASKLIRKYINIMSTIFRKAIYNIYYNNLTRATKKELTQLITETVCLIRAYTLNCYRFMNANGDKHLATWIEFGIGLFPYVVVYTWELPDQFLSLLEAKLNPSS